MSEVKQFKLPDVGEGLTEADIVKWLVKPGDTVAVNQIIVEIETAKALVELPSPYAGVVDSLLVPEGATADVGTPIIAVATGDGTARAALATRPIDLIPPPSGGTAGMISAPPAGDAAADMIPSPPADRAVEPGLHGSPAPKAERQAVLVGYGVKLGTTTRRPRKKPAAAPGQVPAAGHPVVLAKPPVRKLARDLGVDLARLAGTGPQGSITRNDVQAAIPAPAGAADPATDPCQTARLASLSREERIPIRGIRKHTAAAMTASAFTAPHVTEFLQIDVTETMRATARIRSMPEFDGMRVSPLLLVARSLLLAIARHPMINSSWDEAAQEIVVRHYVNLGIAATTDRGLVVPNVKDAHSLALPDLARAIATLAETARAGKATPADMAGGTITITNVGVFGIDTGTPILSPGEAAILAFGQVKDAPWVHEGELAVRKVCTLALSFDHRIVDGDLGSAVLRDVGAMLTDPLRLVAWA